MNQEKIELYHTTKEIICAIEEVFKILQHLMQRVETIENFFLSEYKKDNHDNP